MNQTCENCKKFYFNKKNYCFIKIGAPKFIEKSWCCSKKCLKECNMVSYFFINGEYNNLLIQLFYEQDKNEKKNLYKKINEKHQELIYRKNLIFMKI